tara:strand:- start:478 stop:1641 length:1164 start_codon:yes stop_codon:yes gene_type:complete
MKKENQYCYICGNKNSNHFDLGSFHLSMNIAEKESYRKKLNCSPKYHYFLNECKNCNYYWLRDNHPSLLDSNEFIKYYDLRVNSNEPENHFNELVTWLKDLNILKKDMNVGLASYKDKSLFIKIKNFALKNSSMWIENDLLEICNSFNSNRLEKNEKNSQNKFDFIIARHILEHFFNPRTLMDFIDASLSKKGTIYFEVPSPINMIREGLSYFLWEEHNSYFTTNALRKLFHSYGFKACFRSFKNGKEPILCIVLSRLKISSEEKLLNDRNLSINLFKEKHNLNKNKIRSYLKEKNIKNLYFLGAGHLGMKAVCFYDLKEFLKGFVDDMQVKQKKLSLANGLEIFSSNDLEEGSTLIHVLPPESVQRIKKKPNYKNYYMISLTDIVN